MASFFRNNGLTVVLMVLFALSITGQWLSGWRVANEELAEHGGRLMSLAHYTVSADFLSAVFENWESEFLQMAMYVLLTSILVQRGSAESKDLDKGPRDRNLALQAGKPGAPGILSAGRMARALYANSLFLALATLFVLSFVIHWTQSAHVAAQAALQHGEVPATTLQYLADPQLWFESFQNWQSEFLSTAVLVVLSIFLRQRESPESKAVAAPHDQTGS